MATQVLAAGSDGSQVDISRWNILYPNYLNAAKTVPEGRRIAKAKWVALEDSRMLGADSERCSERQLLEKMGEVIPTLKSRTHPPKEEHHHGKEAPAASSKATAGHPHKSNKKKNKRK